MKDAMLGVLYEKCFAARNRAEAPGQGETSDRRREVAIAENKLLSDLIGIRTDQIRRNTQGAI